MKLMLKLMGFYFVLIFCSIIVSGLLDKFGVDAVVTGAVVALGVSFASLVVLYRCIIKPVHELYEGLSVIDFTNDVIDFSKVDSMDGSGWSEVQSIISKFKYLLDIMSERINKINIETSRGEHDELSGCYNRAHLERVKSAYEMGKSVFILFIDVNNLKRMNDEFGHEAGDTLLRTAASALKPWNAYGDVYRLGGDEFMVVVADRPEDSCKSLVRKWYPQVGVLNRESDGFKCVLSYGMAFGETGCDFDKLQKLADDRMYEFKKAIKAKFGEPMR